MPVLPTTKIVADLAEKYEFGDAREKRRCFDKLREGVDEALRLIKRQQAAIDRLAKEKPKTSGAMGDIFDSLYGRK